MKSREKEVLIRWVLNVLAIVCFAAAIDFIFNDRIWLFLLFIGLFIFMVFSPSNPDFYSSKLNSLRDLSELKVVIDVYSASAIKVGLLLSFVGFLGQIWFEG